MCIPSYIPLYIFRIIRVVLTLLGGTTRSAKSMRGRTNIFLQLDEKYLPARCAVSVLSLVTLDISVKYEIYTTVKYSQITLRDIAKYAVRHLERKKKKRREKEGEDRL